MPRGRYQRRINKTQYDLVTQRFFDDSYRPTVQEIAEEAQLTMKTTYRVIDREREIIAASRRLDAREQKRKYLRTDEELLQ